MAARRTKLKKAAQESASRIGFVLALITLLTAAPGYAPASDEALNWQAVHEPSRAIQAGSPLDFSTLFNDPSAGSLGPVRSNDKGQLVVGPKHAPQRLRFHCGSLSWSPASGSFPDHETADRYAIQMRRHGYNLARFHFVDAILMSGSDADFDFDPVQLDRFHYLMAALKKNGIYWMIDVLTSQNGAIGGVVPHRWDDQHNLKMRIHVEQRAKRHWERLAKALLGRKNPYTGLKTARDPALAIVVATNENNIEFTAILEQDRTGRAYAHILQPAFNAYLKRRYKTDQALREAWGRLGHNERLSDGTIRLPASRRERGPRMRDLQIFFHETEKQTLQWSTKYLRGLGFKGPVSAYNNWAISAAHLSRGELPLVTMNAYHDIVLSFAPGTAINQTSSIADSAAYLRSLIGSRWDNKPFIVTEHQHLFWNQHRYESGVLVPAIAGLQDWDGICRHGPGPSDLTTDTDLSHKKRIMPYEIGLDPIARAAETLTALIYRRQDAKPSSIRLLVPHENTGDLLDDGQGHWPDDLTKVGLIAGFALSNEMLAETARPDSTAKTPRRIPVDRARFETPPFWKQESPADTLIERLRSEKLFPAPRSNNTDIQRGIFKSDTGQLSINTAEKTAVFISDKTEAIAFDRPNAAIDLNAVTLRAATSRGVFAVSAIDGQSLTDSSKLLVIYATDARNSGMKFADDDAKIITDFGHRPTLIRKGKLEATLKTVHSGGWWLHRLDLTGRTTQSDKVKTADGKIAFMLNTGSAKAEPTTYWAIEHVPDKASPR
ncbi:MAG: glycoside hydrolase [Pseudomonadota bacterium]